MPQRETGVSRPTPSLYGLQGARGHFRFRATPEPSADPMRRVWRATYSHDEGWSYFQIVVNLGRNSCVLHRSGDADYTSLLRELSEALFGAQLSSPAVAKVESLSFDAELVGLKMSREAGAPEMNATTGTFRSGPQGDWVVMQLYVPGSSDSFLLGLNERIGAGEIVLSRRESATSVLGALHKVFG